MENIPEELPGHSPNIPYQLVPNQFGYYDHGYTPKDLRFILLNKIITKGPHDPASLNRLFENVVQIEEFINKAEDDGVKR